MKVKCYKGLKGCDTETIEVEKSAILKNIRNLFIRKEFIELDNRKKKDNLLFYYQTYTETSYLYDMYHL